MLARGSLEVTITHFQRVVGTGQEHLELPQKNSQMQEKGWECLAQLLIWMREHLEWDEEFSRGKDCGTLWTRRVQVLPEPFGILP